MAYVHTMVINFNPDGSFASGTQQMAGVIEKIDGVDVEIPQPNEPIDLAGARAILKGA